ncbi:Protease Do-like 2 [Durusdinium trenchii]|uniref:Chloroplastic n=1 Tax=Durusdinium trenchii TaxID=1381693 RepID=A0ABP0RNQ2_9DINO
MPRAETDESSGQVQTYGPDVDLALVKIEESVEQDFWAAVADAPPVELAEALPALQETVRALGFPTGGRTLCITEGVVSRVDSIELTPPADTTLVIQIDAAINPGNSGGPVFDSRGYITGVAFCKDVRNCTDNIGYARALGGAGCAAFCWDQAAQEGPILKTIPSKSEDFFTQVIPAAVVRTFLDRCGKERDGYTLSPSVPYRWHKLENQSLRAAHKVPHEISGVLLTSVAPFLEGSLKVSDVLMKIDGRTISDDGQIELRGHELIQHRYLLRNKGIGDKTTFVVFREGQKVECPPVELKDLPPICPRWPDVDYLPEYVILGALALVPLAQGHHWYKEPSGECPVELKSTIDRWNKRWPGDRDGREQLVLLVTVFAHELTFGYNRGWRVVESYNGTRITSLRHVRDLWRETHLGREALVVPALGRMELEGCSHKLQHPAKKVDKLS